MSLIHQPGQDILHIFQLWYLYRKLSFASAIHVCTYAKKFVQKKTRNLVGLLNNRKRIQIQSIPNRMYKDKKDLPKTNLYRVAQSCCVSQDHICLFHREHFQNCVNDSKWTFKFLKLIRRINIKCIKFYKWNMNMDVLFETCMKWQGLAMNTLLGDVGGCNSSASIVQEPIVDTR